MQDPELSHLLAWCQSILGPCRLVDSDTRAHGRASVIRLHSPAGNWYLKRHQVKSFWENEVHAYEQWAPVFGDHAPRLVAVHDKQPLALLVSELPGENMLGAGLPISQEQAAWRSAGRALIRLHEHVCGEYFGLSQRDGSSAGDNPDDPEAYLNAEIRTLLETCQQDGLLTKREKAVIQAAQELVPAFAGEQPLPCHRDYGPDNWLILPDGTWSGVIDFEFAHWDVRVDDFSRYPNWEWIHRPDLVVAFHEGYGRQLTGTEETQCLVARTLYALGAVAWGHDNGFYGFEREGREALAHIERLLKQKWV